LSFEGISTDGREKLFTITDDNGCRFRATKPGFTFILVTQLSRFFWSSENYPFNYFSLFGARKSGRDRNAAAILLLTLKKVEKKILFTFY
jgi:hypothetical protein